MLFGLSVKTLLGIISSGLSLILGILKRAETQDNETNGMLKLSITILSKARDDLDIARGVKDALDRTIINNPGSLRDNDEFTVGPPDHPS